MSRGGNGNAVMRAQHVFADEAVGTTSAAFVHADGCPVHEQIAKALSRYERTTARRG